MQNDIRYLEFILWQVVFDNYITKEQNVGKPHPEISTLCVTSANTDIETRVDKKAIKNLPSKRGTGTGDEAPLTVLCPLLKRLDYCT